MYLKFGKRLLDMVIAFCAIVLLSPLLLLLAVLVRCKLGRPILFKQLRPGKGEKIFCLYKFRTMTDARDETGKMLPDEVRLTHFGKWLRSTSLDELPELWNILRGDMSLVGPRPLLVEYLHLYNVEQRKRHDVRPGLTGLAQVSGRNTLSWEERFTLDVAYVEKANLLFDIKIIWKTVAKVFKREGISGINCETMTPFCGSQSEENTHA